MDKAMQQGAQPGAKGPGIVQGAQAPQGDEKSANAYQRILTAVGKIIYDKRITPQLLEIVKQSASPIDGIVAATMMVLDDLRGKVKGIHPNFVYTVSVTAALLIAEIAEAARIIRADPKKMEQYKQALVQALMKALAQRQGDAAPAQQPAAAPAAGEASADAPHGEMPAGGEETPAEDEVPDEDEDDEVTQ